MALEREGKKRRGRRETRVCGAFDLKWKMLKVGALSSLVGCARAEFPYDLAPRQIIAIRSSHPQKTEDEFIAKLFQGADAEALKAHFKDMSSTAVFTWTIKLDFVDPEIARLVAACNPDQAESMEFTGSMFPTAPLSMPASVFRSTRIHMGTTKMASIRPIVLSCDEMVNYADREAHLSLLRWGGFAYINDSDELIGLGAVQSYEESSAKEDIGVGMWFDSPVVIDASDFDDWKLDRNGEAHLAPVVSPFYRSKKAKRVAYLNPNEVVRSRYGGYLFEFDSQAEFNGKPITEATGTDPGFARSTCLFYPILGEVTGIFPDGLGPFTLVKSPLNIEDALPFTSDNTWSRIVFGRSDMDVRIQVIVESQWGGKGKEFALPILTADSLLTMFDGTPLTREYALFEGVPTRHLMTVFAYPAVDLDTGNGNLVPGNPQTMYSLTEDNWKQYVGMTDGGIIFVGVKPDDENDISVELEQRCIGRSVRGSCQFHFMTMIPDNKGRFKFGRAINWRELHGIEKIPASRFAPVTNPLHRAAGAKSYCWITEKDNVNRLSIGIAYRFVDERRNVAFQLRGTREFGKWMQLVLGGSFYCAIFVLLLVLMGGIADAFVQKKHGKVPLWMSKWLPRLAGAWKEYFRSDFAGQEDDARLELQDKE